MANFTWNSSNVGAEYTPYATQEQLDFVSLLDNIYGTEVLVDNYRLISVQGKIDYGYSVKIDIHLTNRTDYEYSGDRLDLVLYESGKNILNARIEGNFTTDGYDFWGYVSKEFANVEDIEFVYEGSYSISKINSSNTTYAYRKNHEYLTGGNDTFRGTNANDTLYSGSGDDFIFGNRGDDKLYGEDGNDVIYGSRGNDTLYGGSRVDILFGGDGFDTLYGGAGNDSLNGEDGNDEMYGGTGIDIANFKGNYSDYSFVKVGSNLKVVDNRVGKNRWTDTLNSIELLDFADKSSVNTSRFLLTTSAYAWNNYKLLSDTKTSASDAITGLTNSTIDNNSFKVITKEHNLVSSDINCKEIVSNSYEDSFHKDLGFIGMNSGLDQLSRGDETSYAALLGFAESAENKALFTDMTGFG